MLKLQNKNKEGYLERPVLELLIYLSQKIQFYYSQKKTNIENCVNIYKRINIFKFLYK